ncbi:NADPH-dependent FMN reductase [Limosilactobacillus caecicola]|uniref:NADPH-dependent FMN reductase n=1 Tax=Limosilactobacillus caecicola TaxID=2941332 RepID=UPI00204254D9|nr:NAD(P)H-dependent oxidoreductase [Limosilactobacillus caecicola]
MNHYIAIAGTNRQGSNNLKLVKYIQKRCSNVAAIEVMSIADLPVFYKTPDHSLPKRVVEMGERVKAADGVIISTPEYNHAVPAVLMNALEWLSYSSHPFKDQPVLIMGASYGTLGTSRAQQMLRKMLEAPELSARVMPNAEFLVGHANDAFDDQGNLADSQLADSLDRLLADFNVFVDINRDLEFKRNDALRRIQNLEKD